MTVGARPIANLFPPSVIKRAPWQDRPETRVSNWIEQWDFAEEIDAGLIGAPYSAASISPSGAAGGPESVRMAFRYNTTYSPDWDTDITALRVRDLGDIGGHLTDVAIAHGKIESVVREALTLGNHFLPIIIGGDHSITAPAVRGFLAAHEGKKVGIINIDAHYDVRVDDWGPHNGTPFRQLIEGGINGKNVVELGIHGFMNASWYRLWCNEQGVTTITGRDVYKRGMEACILEALGIAGDGTDLIYVSVDIDALSYPWAPGTSASSAEGLSAWDLLEAMFICGQHPNVAALDVVEIDPTRDVQGVTARAGCSTILAFLAGLQRRLHGNRGY
jgi:formiminoglutamase